MGPELFHRALYHRIVSYVFALYNRNPKFMSITKWYKKDSYGVVNGISAAHVVKDYTNKAKTDMFLPLSER